MPDASNRSPRPVLPVEVTRQAVDWLVRLQADVVEPHTREDWQRWRGQHPHHELAWQQIEEASAHFRQGAGPLARQVLARAAQRARTVRRRVLKSMVGVGVLGSMGYGVSRQVPAWQAVRADLRTATGERRELTLADGTHIVMNTATAIDVHLDEQWRRIVLHRGEIHVQTAVASAQDGHLRAPFVVDTAQGRAQALGTRFSVSQGDGHTEVRVYAHAVRIQPAAQGARAQVLAAGHQARFTRLAVEPPVSLPAQSDAWIHGVLVAQDMPLQDFLAELARHRRGWLSCDARLAALRISGVFPLEDTDRVLDMLVRTQPVRLVTRTRYWVVVQPQ